MGALLAAFGAGALVGLIYPDLLGLSNVPGFTRIIWVLEFGGAGVLLVLFVSRYRMARAKLLERLEKRE